MGISAMLHYEWTESLKWNWTQVQMFALESSSTYDWEGSIVNEQTLNVPRVIAISRDSGHRSSIVCYLLCSERMRVWCDGDPMNGLCCVWTHLTQRWRMSPARPGKWTHAHFESWNSVHVSSCFYFQSSGWKLNEGKKHLITPLSPTAGLPDPLCIILPLLPKLSAQFLIAQEFT